jgi:uncharacterized YccA/Bax inhibitor family protein
MFKNWVTTVGGVMAGLGTLPLVVSASHVAFPLWWNYFQFPLYLVGAIGTIILGLAAKGADQHSTATQVAIASAENEVAKVKKVDEESKP